MMKKELLFSVILSITTFALGLTIGYLLIGSETLSLHKKYEEIKILVDSALYYFQEYNSYCSTQDLYILGKKVDSLGYQIELLENSENPFKDYKRIKILKSYYFNLEYLHYLLAKKQLKRCNSTFNIILYFYLPEKECKVCKRQGYQLTHLKKKYPTKVLIYSFDLSYPNYFIYYYKEKYNIKNVPFIILITKNYTKVFEGYITWNQIEKYMIT